MTKNLFFLRIVLRYFFNGVLSYLRDVNRIKRNRRDDVLDLMKKRCNILIGTPKRFHLQFVVTTYPEGSLKNQTKPPENDPYVLTYWSKVNYLLNIDFFTIIQYQKYNF